MENIADMKDPNDPQGRAYREVNHAIDHTYSVGNLVEIDNGARLFITRLTRDCDGTPLYAMGPKTGHSVVRGYPEEIIIKLIK